MSNLLSNEQTFLSLSKVKTNLNLSNVEKLKTNIDNAQKRKFDNTLQLAEIVAKSFEWFKSENGKALCQENGIKWNSEQFALKVYGYQKSFFYKLVKAAEIDDETIERFKAKCEEIEQRNEKSQRNLDSLLRFAKDENCLDGESEDGEQKAETIFTLAFKSDTNVSVRINSEAKLETKNSKEEILKAIEFLQGLL